MPVPEIDLCTLADVRGRRQTAAGETEQDPEVARIITGVSAAIADDYKREFIAVSDATRIFELSAGVCDRLILVPHEIRTVSQIRINPDGDEPIVLEASDYQLAPNPAEHGTYHRVRLRPGVFTVEADAWNRTLVEITGDWGFAEIPENVREAAIVSVVHNMRTSVGQYSVADGQGGETRFERAEIPQAARDLLKPFDRQDRYF